MFEISPAVNGILSTLVLTMLGVHAGELVAPEVNLQLGEDPTDGDPVRVMRMPPLGPAVMVAIGMTMLVTVKVVKTPVLTSVTEARVMVRTPAVRAAVGGGVPPQLVVQAATGELAPCVKPVRVTTTLATVAMVAGVKVMVRVVVTPATANDRVIAGAFVKTPTS